MRQQLVGIEAVLGGGSIVSRLDAPPKDNVGYDLAGLLSTLQGLSDEEAEAFLSAEAGQRGAV